MSSMKDKRQFVRKALHCTVSVFNEDAKNVGVMADYSEDGLMISSYLPIEVGQKFLFTIIDLPNNIGNKRTGHVTVQSKWSDKISLTQFGTGFKLINQDEQAKIMFGSYDGEP